MIHLGMNANGTLDRFSADTEDERQEMLHALVGDGFVVEWEPFYFTRNIYAKHPDGRQVVVSLKSDVK